jgi:RHS repeat-associated protein
MAKANPIRFSTKYDDDESDLLYYDYRYYKPSTRTWLNRDPIMEKGGINLYEFVNNSPVDLIDPKGLKFGDGKICGNYCGGGYCGGKRLKPGESCDFSVPPTDSRDSCCKTHDKCYDDVQAGNTTKEACDAALCQCSKIASLYRRSCDKCGSIAYITVPLWARYLTLPGSPPPNNPLGGTGYGPVP